MTGLRTASLCTGYAGLDAAVHAVLGGELAWVADNDPGASAILAHRFPSVPNYGDISVIDWAAVERPGVLTAGFPCQDVSCAGARKGLRAGTRTGVWSHVAEAIAALRPSLVLLENVRGLLSAGADSDMEFCPWCLGDSGDESALRALGAVLGDLADLGFDAEWQVVSAADAGAPHRRERVFILAWPSDANGTPRGRHEPGSGPGPVQGPAVAERAPEQPGRLHSGDRGAVPVAVQDADRATGDQRRLAAPGQAASGWARADAGRPGGARVAADAGDGLLAADPGAVASGEAGGERRDAGADRGSRDRGGAPPADASSGRRRPGERDVREGQPDASRGTLADPGRPRLGEQPGGTPSQEAGPLASHKPSGDRGARPDSLGRTAAADSDGDGLPRGEERDSGTQGGQGDHAGRRVDPLRRVLDWGPYGPAVERWERVLGRPAPRPTEPGKTAERLSPAFVEWMQGLPAGWVTDVPGLSRNAMLKALGNGVVPQQAELALRLLLGRSGLLVKAGEAA